MARIDLRNCDIFIRDGLAGTALSAKKTNEIQTITIAGANDGTFTVEYDSEVSGDLPWNLTPAQLQSALEGLVSIGEGNVLVTSGGAGVYIVEFIGALAEQNLDLMVIDDTNILPSPGGSVTISDPATQNGGTGDPPVETDDTLSLASVTLNALDPDLVPIGARFTIAGEKVAMVHVVQSRVPADDPVTGPESPTTQITFLPALGEATTSYSTGALLTFQSQEVEIKVGEGDFKYTEANQYKYDLDRGQLDTVRTGDDQPMDVSMNFTFDQVKSGTGEVITPIEAIKGIGPASEWVSSSQDLCEPYAVDLIVVDTRICSGANSRTYVFPDFRSEKRDYDIKAATIAVSGKCNATEPIITVGA